MIAKKELKESSKYGDKSIKTKEEGITRKRKSRKGEQIYSKPPKKDHNNVRFFRMTKYAIEALAECKSITHNEYHHGELASAAILLLRRELKKDYEYTKGLYEFLKIY